MLRNLRLYFYNNKVIILRNIAIIVLIIIAIQVLNNTVKTKSAENNKKYESEFSYGNIINFSNSVSINNTSNSLIENNTNYNENIASNTISENNTTSETNENTNIREKKIEIFLDFCINGNIDEAYDMLSDECKSLLYPDINSFKEKYYSRIFSAQKVYTIDNYLGNTYKIKIAENMNNTGSYTALANEEYITAHYVNGGYKLNISHYIGRDTIGKTSTNENITIKVNYKDIFMDYERYNITITNNYPTTIMLDTKNSTNTMYLLGSNDIKYYAYSNEIIDNSLILKSGSTVNLNIKYKNTYTLSTNATNYLVFSNIIIDYDTYRNLENKSDYNNIEIFKANI